MSPDSARNWDKVNTERTLPGASNFLSSRHEGLEIAFFLGQMVGKTSISSPEYVVAVLQTWLYPKEEKEASVLQARGFVNCSMEQVWKGVFSSLSFSQKSFKWSCFHPTVEK